MTHTLIMLSLLSYSLALISYTWGLRYSGRLWVSFCFWLLGALIDGIILVSHHYYPWPVWAHIELSIINVSIMCFALLHAVLVLWQNFMLKRHYHLHYLQNWPAAQVMEQFLFQIVGLGVLALTANVLLSCYLFYPFQNRYIFLKVLFSGLIWLVLVGLLLGRYLYGWRGKIALQWIGSSLILLISLYVASIIKWNIFLISV